MIMKAPHTYTGEDTVEIDCHGGILAQKKVLETAVKYGARPAEPGEFTKRAFLNGKMDLSQAEAVIDVINAKNEYALKSSLSQLKGSLEKKIKEIRENLIYQVAFIESALDDPERNPYRYFGKTKCGKIFSFECACERRKSHRHGYRGNHQGYPGRKYYASRYIIKAY